MIFVTVGASTFPFDRLLRAVAELETEEAIIAQVGASLVQPSNAHCVAYLPMSELVEHVRRARVVVSHAGVGSILTALSEGKTPIVVPRRAEFGEAVDGHQLQIAQSLASQERVVHVEDLDALRVHVLARAGSAHALNDDTPLVREIARYALEVLGSDPEPEVVKP